MGMSLHPPASPLLSVIDDFANARVLCIGDVMLDRFNYGTVERISPEAPIPVIHCEREARMLGGAGNVLRNLVSLGATVNFISVVGEDETGNAIMRLIGEQPRCIPYVLVEPGRLSTEKVRYIAQGQQMFRADHEERRPISDATQNTLVRIAAQAMPECRLVILSDYAKGVLTEHTVATLIEEAGRQGIPVIVDPKSRSFQRYSGAFLLTPNLKELRLACDGDPRTTDEITAAAREQMRRCGIAQMIVTMGAAGMLVIPSAGEPLLISAEKREVFDVSGAGDTVIATLAAALATDVRLEDAAFIANIAAGIAVGRTGTATVYRTDLKTAVHTLDVTHGSAKIFPLDLAAEQVESWQHDGLRVGFTNGCFDMVHPGHLSLLADARAQCDRLIVAINSDASVKRLKGENRPVNNEMERALLLAELRAVDMVVIFREDTPMEILTRLRPDVLMKGGDYTLDQVVGRALVESYGGHVRTIPLREGYSTTATIARIQAKSGG